MFSSAARTAASRFAARAAISSRPAVTAQPSAMTLRYFASVSCNNYLGGHINYFAEMLLVMFAGQIVCAEFVPAYTENSGMRLPFVSLLSIVSLLCLSDKSLHRHHIICIFHFSPSTVIT